MKLKWGLSFLFFIIGLSFLTYSCYQNRVYDWDLPGYLGSIYSWDFPDNPQKVHELTYSSMKSEAPVKSYNDIVGLNLPNKVFEKNSSAFSEQIPYYKIKVGFNAAVYVFYKCGFSAPTSVLLVNIIAYFVSGILLFFFLKYIFRDNYFIAPILSLFVMGIPAMRGMAENPTPDMFLLVFMMLFLISVLQKRSVLLQFVLLLSCVLIRPDYILFALTFLFVRFIYEYLKKSKKINYYLVVQGFLLVTIYIFILKMYHYPGWKDVFYDSFISRRVVISAEKADFTFKQYWDILIFKLINFKRITLISSVLVFLIFYFSKGLWMRTLAVLFFVNIYIKFIFFPDGGTLRFFLGFVILLFMVLLYVLSKKYDGFKLRKIA
ncbi:hypothetical protein [Chryseobacterium sp. GP-SGM7]|uniref:hypothetical protein n=1 Tax=Chryseobacterium sp. GP-SGM7 TaxID=3411323 RepID=UPI003B957701